MALIEGGILVINAGSSSIKYALFDDGVGDGGLAEVLAGQRDVDPVVAGAFHSVAGHIGGVGAARVCGVGFGGGGAPCGAWRGGFDRAVPD
jgi:hypothetical protein